MSNISHADMLRLGGVIMRVKEDLKLALSKLVIEESHEDYQWFEWVFRYGIMLGSEGNG